MRTAKPYWQDYWYDLRFRAEDEYAFTRLGSGPLRQISNTTLLTVSVTAFADRVLAEGASELDDLRGEPRVLVYPESDPLPDAEPVVTRTIELTGPARGRGR